MLLGRVCYFTPFERGFGGKSKKNVSVGKFLDLMTLKMECQEGFTLRYTYKCQDARYLISEISNSLFISQ